MKLILPILIAFYCSQALSWGIDGHKIVAQVAEKNLSAEARKKINLLLDNESLPSVSLWADIVKFTPLYSYTTEWHFINLPDDFNPSSNQFPQNSVVSAIVEMCAVIKDPTKSTGDKRRAVKFLVHFVGDIHQPLHVGRGEDRGGNDIEVSYNGDRMNLHSLWDTDLISEADLNYKKYADYLETYYMFSGTPRMLSFPFGEVVAENLSARKAIYDFPAATNGGRIILDNRYLDKNREFLNKSLYMGGMRLAALLNGLF